MNEYLDVFLRTVFSISLTALLFTSYFINVVNSIGELFQILFNRDRFKLTRKQFVYFVGVIKHAQDVGALLERNIGTMHKYDRLDNLTKITFRNIHKNHKPLLMLLKELVNNDFNNVCRWENPNFLPEFVDIKDTDSAIEAIEHFERYISKYVDKHAKVVVNENELFITEMKDKYKIIKRDRNFTSSFNSIG